MNIIYKVIFVIAFILALIGCNRQSEFDRVNAINQYAWTNDIYNAPTTKNIKSQIIKEGNNDKFFDIQEISSDKKGHVISYRYYLNNEVYPIINGVKFNLDYSKMKMTYQIPILDINIENVDFLLDSSGNFSQLMYNSNIIKNLYHNGKITSFSARFNSNLIMKDSFDWNNNLITKFSSSLIFNGKFSTVEYYYSYDEQARLVEVDVVKMNAVKMNTEFQHEKIIMTKFNEYGDWIEAKRVIDKIGEINITRKIEYW